MRETSAVFVGVGVLLACVAAVAAPLPPKGGGAQQTATEKVPEPPAWKYGVAHPGFQFTLDPSVVPKPKTGKNGKNGKNTTGKEKIFCGLYYPPTYSNVLFFVNNTNKTLPKGTRVQWILHGENERRKPKTFKGVTTPSPSAWTANPPTNEYWATGPLPEVYPQQAWDRPCEAWAILP